MNWNSWVTKDGKDVFGVDLPYSAGLEVEVPTNVHSPVDYLLLTRMTAGGQKKHNTQDRNAAQELQTLQLCEEGVEIPGRRVFGHPDDPFGQNVVHSIQLHRNRFFEVSEQVEFGDQGRVMQHRCPGSLAFALQSFMGVSLSRRTLYMVTLNRDVAIRDEASSAGLFRKAQDLFGTAEYEEYTQKTGCKGQTLAEMGAVW